MLHRTESWSSRSKTMPSGLEIRCWRNSTISAGKSSGWFMRAGRRRFGQVSIELVLNCVFESSSELKCVVPWVPCLSSTNYSSLCGRFLRSVRLSALVLFYSVEVHTNSSLARKTKRTQNTRLLKCAMPRVRSCYWFSISIYVFQISGRLHFELYEFRFSHGKYNHRESVPLSMR